MILILGGAWQGKLTWAASHGMVGPVFDLSDSWRSARALLPPSQALTRAASDRGETAQQVLDRLLPLTRDAFVISRGSRFRCRRPDLTSSAGARCAARCCRALRPQRSTSAGHFAD